jgi:hypothetical protein
MDRRPFHASQEPAMRTSTLIPILFAAALVGCTPARPGSFEPRPTDRFLLTGEEMGRYVFPSTYDAVERLRPWLLAPLRGEHPQLYIDGLLQPIDVLKSIPTELVVDIRFVHGAEAVRFPGSRNALVLTTAADRRRVR